MELVIQKPITVITPTVGSPKLWDAIESVKAQTYACKHLIVLDGPDVKADRLPWPHDGYENCHIVKTPENTGKTGGNFYGHRIYAAYPHLINSDYILFLDEDNWYEPDHVESLVRTIEEKNLHFSYSLRKIFDPNKNYLCDDNCESLGKWEIFMSRKSPHGKQYLVDTSSFCFRRDFLQSTCHLWHAGWGGDRKYLYAVKDSCNWNTSGKHTLCYRLDGNEGSVTEQFFVEGNKTQEDYYEGKYPWVKI